MEFKTEYLPEVIAQIEQHPDQIRIKKILYGLTNKVWENDPNVIGNFSTYTLLNNLGKLQPTMKRLVMTMNGLIKSLNRQDVYVPIAKKLLVILATLYEISMEEVDKLIHETILEEKERHKQNNVRNYINLMEVVVKEEIYNELQKLPVNIAKFMSIAEIASYTLNRLPPMYVASEEGRYFQMKKIEQMRGEIRSAVLQGIGAVMRDPLRKSTPLNMEEVDAFSTAHSLLVELEDFVATMEGRRSKIPLNELSARIKQGVQDYEHSLKDIEQVLKVFEIEHEKITVKNLGGIVRKLLRRLEQNESQAQRVSPRRPRPSAPMAPAKPVRPSEVLDAHQTALVDFLQDGEEDNGEETFATSVRDWYPF